jgi:hypothetical protein
MKNTVAKIGSINEIAQLTDLTTEELRLELTREIRDFATRLIRVAAIWVELERRGEDLSDLRSGLNVYLPAIAAGTVLADTVVRFSGKPQLLKAIAQLTPIHQQTLLDGGTVPLVINEQGKYSHRMLPAHALSSSQIRQVFGERAIRTEAEQIAILSRPVITWKPGKIVSRGKVHVDRGAGTVRIGRSIAAANDVIAALRACGMIT